LHLRGRHGPAGAAGAVEAGRLRRPAGARHPCRAQQRPVLRPVHLRRDALVLDEPEPGHPLDRLAAQHSREAQRQQPVLLHQPGPRAGDPRGEHLDRPPARLAAVPASPAHHLRRRRRGRPLHPEHARRRVEQGEGLLVGAQPGRAGLLRRLPRGVSAMKAPVVRRFGTKLASAVLVLLVAASITFFVQLLLPGDRATVILNVRNGRDQEWPPEEIAAVNAQFGFDRPLLLQYLDYLTGLLRGDLGTSYTEFRPVTDVIGAQLVPSVILTLGAL